MRAQQNSWGRNSHDLVKPMPYVGFSRPRDTPCQRSHASSTARSQPATFVANLFDAKRAFPALLSSTVPAGTARHQVLPLSFTTLAHTHTLTHTHTHTHTLTHTHTDGLASRDSRAGLLLALCTNPRSLGQGDGKHNHFRDTTRKPRSQYEFKPQRESNGSPKVTQKGFARILRSHHPAPTTHTEQQSDKKPHIMQACYFKYFHLSFFPKILEPPPLKTNTKNNIQLPVHNEAGAH